MPPSPFPWDSSFELGGSPHTLNPLPLLTGGRHDRRGAALDVAVLDDNVRAEVLDPVRTDEVRRHQVAPFGVVVGE